MACVRSTKRAYAQTPEGTRKGTVRSREVINACRNRPSKQLPDREIYISNENWRIDNFGYHADFCDLHTASLSEWDIQHHVQKEQERQIWLEKIAKNTIKIDNISEDSLDVDNEDVTEADLFAYPL